MTNYVKLDNVDHADLAVAVSHGAAFGDAVNQQLVFPTEFEQLQREYPILFRRDEQAGYYAVVLLGLDLDENLFLDDGGWKARYIPVVHRRGPFALGGEPGVFVDLDDARVGAEGAEPLFLRHGGESPYLQHVTAVLQALRHGADSAAPFFAELAAEGLIKPVTLTIEVGDGSTYTVADVFTIDEDRLAALEGAPLARLHRSGVLRAATMAAASLSNVQYLAERKAERARR